MMIPRLSRVEEDEELVDYEFTKGLWNKEKLKSLAMSLKLVQPRTFAWCILLDIFGETDTEESILLRINNNRKYYDSLNDMYSKDPRSSLDDDPLSQNDSSLWNQHFCDNELKALILQDVIRTFPDEPYFRSNEVQMFMVRVLFIWSRANPDIGYRQGMHEILAQIIYELNNDINYAPINLSDLFRTFLQQEYLEHDCYTIFTQLMRELSMFYRTNDTPLATGRLPRTDYIHSTNDIVKYLDTVRSEHLVPLDKELADHLNECNITLELFGIRWLRLLFGREFPREEISNLWSYLFIDRCKFENIHYIIVAILISMRKILLNDDPAVILSALMRPVDLSIGHVIAFALHLQYPLVHPRPPTPPIKHNSSSSPTDIPSRLEVTGVTSSLKSEDGDGLPEGADVAAELATLALLRAQLPKAVIELRCALNGTLPQKVNEPLQRIMQLSSLLQCRNHALVDVETALEAAESQVEINATKKTSVPVVLPKQRFNNNRKRTEKRVIKEVPLQLFNQIESYCESIGKFPEKDPLHLRTD